MGRVARTVPPALAERPFVTAFAGHHASLGVLRGPAYLRLTRGVHMSADNDASHGWLIQAMRSLYGPEPVLAGVSAAWAHGSRLAGAADAVHVVVPAGSAVRRRAEIFPHRYDLRGYDVVDTSLGRTTSVAFTAVDLARGIGTARGTDSVIAVDSLLRATGLTASRSRETLASLGGRRGLRMAVRILDDARDGVDSPRETEMRLVVAAAGLPEPLVQCPVGDPDGRVVARLDLGWPDWRVGLEYDGAVHLDPRQHSMDLQRHNRIRGAGWVVVQVDARAWRRQDRWLSQVAGFISTGLHS